MELLTVIVIIGILAGIMIPVVGRVRESARNAQCASNLRQIGIAMISHAVSDRSGCFPESPEDPVDNPLLDTAKDNWMKAIAPLLSVQNYNTSVVDTVFRCPSANCVTYAPYSYVMNRNLTANVASPGKVRKPLSALLAPAQALLIRHSIRRGNAATVVEEWVGGDYFDTRNGEYNYLFADGHTGRLKPKTGGYWEYYNPDI
ncbi:MAG: DUF1559 domain-containing protein [Opitutaceae bacterium]|nr:DUF1559 domain-containing protein [Opitutaceae bacterium]